MGRPSYNLHTTFTQLASHGTDKPSAGNGSASQGTRHFLQGDERLDTRRFTVLGLTALPDFPSAAEQNMDIDVSWLDKALIQTEIEA